MGKKKISTGLHLFVQHTKQGDGERRVEFAPQPVYVLEVVKPKGD